LANVSLYRSTFCSNCNALYNSSRSTNPVAMAVVVAMAGIIRLQLVDLRDTVVPSSHGGMNEIGGSWWWQNSSISTAVCNVMLVKTTT
jgi:hypothetical protein